MLARRLRVVATCRSLGINLVEDHCKAARSGCTFAAERTHRETKADASSTGVAGLLAAAWAAGLGLRQRHCSTGAGPAVNCAEAPTAPSAAMPLEGRDFTVFQRSPDGLNATPAAQTRSLKDLVEALCAPTSAVGSSTGDGGGLNVRPRVVLLGEVHDDTVAHALQLRVLRHCYEMCQAQGRRLVLSLEMFESDVQRVLDEYVVQRAIREEDMLQDARPWANYVQDYRPLVEFCRDHGVRVVAANAPRRYVSLVARRGAGVLQALVDGGADQQVSRDVPPLPLPPASAAYCQKFVETIASQMAPPQESGAEGGGCPFIGFRASDVREAKPEMLEAQLLWDHAMARSIAGALEGGGPEALVLHVCGAFHCAHGLGIPEALPRYTELPRLPTDDAPWLPMDDALPAEARASEAAHGAEPVGPKPCPAGVVSVVCWPACVSATLELVQSGVVPQSLGTMADWVVITEETFGEAPPRKGAAAPARGERSTTTQVHRH